MGATARRQRLSPLAALSARPSAAAAGLGALSPAAGSRPIFGMVKKWTGVTERDATIADLQAENAAHLEAMGDLQARSCTGANARARFAPPPAAGALTLARAGRAAAHARRAERGAEARGFAASGEKQHQ
jgi:hypothetical protein